MVIEDRTETLQGEIIGWAEYSHRFELRLHADHKVVVGAVSRQAMDHLLQEGMVPLHRHVQAQVKVREMRLRHRAPRQTFVLQSMEPISPPADWPARAVLQKPI